MQNQNSMSALDWSLLATLSLLWGGSFFFTGVAVKELPPFTLVFLRVCGAALILHLVILLRGRRMPGSPKIWFAFFVMGLINNLVPFSLIVWGQTHIASGLAAILNATTPLSTAIVAHFLTSDEKLRPHKLAGVLVGFAGVAVMIGPELLTGFSTNILAQAAILLAALSYAFASVFGKRFKTMGVQPIHTATGQLTASAAMALPLALLVDNPLSLPMPGLDIWLAVAGYIILSTALAYIIFFRILASAGATNLALVTFLIPVSAILLGVLFLGEVLETEEIMGMVLIGVGLALIDGRILRWRRVNAA
ncbi:DMT family transporter [Rhizobium sp. L1K21]|uniref:DMT family transporter n=1 Tax=Rhizobium sp. L1K21 TaxID=2954933 RepID=UPI002093A0ED|nr:DMT family transporter [Rhizobium sp. L1K21]MCO6187163.1 DMT family transporter [Rhizobium sp. L1K21]